MGRAAWEEIKFRRTQHTRKRHPVRGEHTRPACCGGRPAYHLKQPGAAALQKTPGKCCVLPPPQPSSLSADSLCGKVKCGCAGRFKFSAGRGKQHAGRVCSPFSVYKIAGNIKSREHQIRACVRVREHGPLEIRVDSLSPRCTHERLLRRRSSQSRTVFTARSRSLSCRMR